MHKFGIRISLPTDSTMNKDHLLGKDWEAFRWYDSAQNRDHAFIDMQSQPGNYRIGDTIQQVLEKIDR